MTVDAPFQVQALEQFPSQCNGRWSKTAALMQYLNGPSAVLTMFLICASLLVVQAVLAGPLTPELQLLEQWIAQISGRARTTLIYLVSVVLFSMMFLWRQRLNNLLKFGCLKKSDGTHRSVNYLFVDKVCIPQVRIGELL